MTEPRHLIAGRWNAGADAVDAACEAAEAAFEPFAATAPAARALFLRAIAVEIEARRAAITDAGTHETALPAARLDGERGRTCGQLRLFADHVESGAHLDRRHDPALPDRAPLPRPDLRMVQRPVGPVAVFGASNFPLAFSTAGGDTAAALAAGCLVVVKAHPAHPQVSDLVAEAIDAARRACDLHPGVFGQVHGDREVGAALATHPLIRAVGFTGSLGAGRALFDLCAARPDPIPFFGELGSINPVFVLPAAQAARGAAIGEGWAASLTMGVGQFCTNPGVLVLSPGEGADALLDAAEAALREVAAQPMLTEDMAAAYRDAVKRTIGSRARLRGDCDAGNGAPALLEVMAAEWLADRSLAHEVFGPFGIAMRTGSEAERTNVARSLDGQLTCTLQMDDADTQIAASLVPILERKAGRVLANGFPTGVEVADAMVHGGPYPASTNFGHTSVGTLAIRRWLRPVCYQDMPDALLPAELRA